MRSTDTSSISLISSNILCMRLVLYYTRQISLVLHLHAGLSEVSDSMSVISYATKRDNYTLDDGIQLPLFMGEPRPS